MSITTQLVWNNSETLLPRRCRPSAESSAEVLVVYEGAVYTAVYEYLPRTWYLTVPETDNSGSEHAIEETDLMWAYFDFANLPGAKPVTTPVIDGECV